TNAAAAAASTALPPRSNIAAPEAAESQCVAETAPRGPRSSGRACIGISRIGGGEGDGDLAAGAGDDATAHPDMAHPSVLDTDGTGQDGRSAHLVALAHDESMHAAGVGQRAPGTEPHPEREHGRGAGRVLGEPVAGGEHAA